MEDYHFFYEEDGNMLYETVQAESEEEAWEKHKAKNSESNVRVVLKGPVDLDIVYQE